MDRYDYGGVGSAPNGFETNLNLGGWNSASRPVQIGNGDPDYFFAYGDPAEQTPLLNPYNINPTQASINKQNQSLYSGGRVSAGATAAQGAQPLYLGDAFIPNVGRPLRFSNSTLVVGGVIAIVAVFLITRR